MEEKKKMKTVTIEVFGYELFLQPTSIDDDIFDAYSRYAGDDYMTFSVKRTEYTIDDFSPAEDILSPEQLQEFKDFDVDKFFKESEAEYGMLYVNKAWTTIEIEIPEDEEFDPKKAAVVERKFVNFYSRDYLGWTVCAFAYDGKVYHCAPGDSDGIDSEKIWEAPRKWGYIDKTGAWIVEPKFEEAYPFIDGLAKVMSDGKYGFIDRNGTWVIEPKFDEVDLFSEGMARIKASGKYGFIDKAGTLIIEPKFDDAYPFSEGLACVRENESYQMGYIDKTGAWIVEPKFFLAFPFSDGLAGAMSGCKFGFIDRNGTWVIEPKFDWANPFSEGMACIKVRASGKYGFIDKAGAIIIEPKFDDAYSFREGLARVKENGQWGFIDKNGEFRIAPIFSKVDSFSDGLAYARSADKKGFIDHSGIWVIETDHRVLGSFHEGLVCMALNGKAGYIDKTGNWVIEPRFEGSSRALDYMDFDEKDYRFSEGLAAVTLYRKPI